MLSSSRRVQTRRQHQTPPVSIGEQVSNLVRGLFQPKNDRNDLVDETTAQLEALSLKRVEKMKRKEELNNEIANLTLNGRDVKKQIMERQQIMRDIKNLDGRISLVARNRNIVDNIETDKALAGLVSRLNDYVGEQNKEGTDVAKLEDLLDENDEHAELENERNEHFNAAFDRYNEGLEEDVEQDDELQDIIARANAERELQTEAEFPSVTAVTPKVSRASERSPEPAGRVALTSSANVQSRKPKKIVSWDDGWE